MFAEKVTLPAAADFHVHLRDGAMAEAVVKTVRAGGVNTVYVMPNLVPPITTVAAALEYKKRLVAQDANVNYLMTLYLHSSIKPEDIYEAKKAGIVGVKSYPAGVTTNSDSGVLSYEPFYPVFQAMEECGLVLNLHGECASDHARGIHILNAEAKFLPTLRSLHEKFPKLRIVLEHCTTAAAVEAVRSCGDTVVGTITSHHLFLTVDDWAGNAFNYCKPVAKFPADRQALLDAVVRSGGNFFLGSDSAPHDRSAKKEKAAAGVFTQPYAVSLVLTALEEAAARGEIRAEEDVTQDVLEGFLCTYGRRFYGVEDTSGGEKIVLSRDGDVIVDRVVGDGIEVVPFRAGQKTWGVEWVGGAS